MKDEWRMMKNDEGWMKDDGRWRLNDEGWWFQAVEGFWGQTNKQTDGWIDISECRVTFATQPTMYSIFISKNKKKPENGGKRGKDGKFWLAPIDIFLFFFRVFWVIHQNLQ